MLEQIEAGQLLHLTEIEEMALKLRYKVGQDVVETLAMNESRKQEVEVVCSECHHKMRFKGRKRNGSKRAATMSH